MSDPSLLDPRAMPLTRSSLQRRSPERDREDQRPHAPWTLIALNGRMPVAGGRLVLVERSALGAPVPNPGLPEVYLGELTEVAGARETGGVTVRPFNERAASRAHAAATGTGAAANTATGPTSGTGAAADDANQADVRQDEANHEPDADARAAVELVQRTHEAAGTEHPLEWATLRAIAPALGATEPEHAALAVTAQAVTAWHVDHPRCPRCGEITGVQRSGWMRRCPADASMHFPRTDPAVIVAVTDGDPDPARQRLLLGRSAAWQGPRFSTLAGFVEPGESIEQAVVREIQEEAGLVVDQVRYLGSQPWPFPRSLMIGCTAVVNSGALNPDGEEIVDLRWFTRDQLRAAAEAQEIMLPGKVSIARALIENWLGAELPESGW